MKRDKIIFWIATVFFSAMVMFGGGNMLFGDEGAEVAEMGYTNPWFLTILGVAKLLGGIGLLIPSSSKIKYFIYSGLAINMVMAFLSHLAVGHGAGEFVAPLVALAILSVSFIFWRKVFGKEIL